MWLIQMTRVALGFLVLFSLASRALSTEGQSAENDRVLKAREAVAAAEQRLSQIKELAEGGALPGRRLQQAEIDLAEARISLAALEGKQQAVLDGLTALVEQHQRRWEQLQQVAASGAIPGRSALRARIDLAEARVRLEVRTLLTIREQDVANLEAVAKDGAVPQRTLDEARQALDEARGRIRLVKAPAVQEAAATRVADSDAVKALLKERLATVAEIDKLVQTAYRSAEVGLDQVHQAKAALLAAQLDSAETNDERIKIHQEMVRQAEEWTKSVAEMAKASQATTIDVLKAKARHLEARIAFERAKAAK